MTDPKTDTTTKDKPTQPHERLGDGRPRKTQTTKCLNCGSRLYLGEIHDCIGGERTMKAETTSARDKVGSNPAGSNPAAEPNFRTTKFRGVYLPMKVYYIKMWGMFLAGIWFAQFLRWAIGGFHV